MRWILRDPALCLRSVLGAAHDVVVYSAIVRDRAVGERAIDGPSSRRTARRGAFAGAILSLASACGGAPPRSERAAAPAPAVTEPAQRRTDACMGRDTLRAAIPVSDEDYDRTASMQVELDGREGWELLVTVLDRPDRSVDPGGGIGTMRAWVLRCGAETIDVVTSARWTFVDAPDAAGGSPISTGIRAWGSALGAGDPFRSLVVEVSSADASVRWRRNHAYVLDGEVLREVLACLVYYDAEPRRDSRPQLEGTLRSLPDREPGLEIERHDMPLARGQEPSWIRVGYAWDGARLVPRTRDICTEDDPAPPDAPVETPLSADAHEPDL